MFPATETLRDDPSSPHVEKVPLRPGLLLHLHRPHEPTQTSLTRLVAVQLGDEEGVKEVLVVCLIVVEVSVVILTGLVVGHRIVRSDEAALQIFLTVSYGQGELSSDDWERTPADVLLYPAGFLKVSLPAGGVS